MSGRSTASLTALVAHAKLRVRQIRGIRKNQVPDEKGLRQEVLRLALPATGEQLLSMMVSIVDTMLVGHLGASALAAVSLATQWTFMAVTLFTAVSTGSTALVARSVGGKDWDTANRTVRQSVLVGLCIGLATTALAQLFAEPALAVLGAEPEVLALGVTYMRIASSVFALSAVMFVGNACLRGAGDTRTAMVVMAVVNVLNVAVAWIAINGPFGLPRLGVAGSALGAAVGRAAGGVLVVGILVKSRSGLRLELRHWRVDSGIIRRVLRVGLPTGGERLIMRLGMMAFVRVVASLGTVAVAAHTVALRAESLSYMPGFGFAVAGTTLVGQGLGARDPRRAERSGYLTYQMAAALMAVMGLVFILFAQPLIRLFTDDPMVVQTAVTPLRIVGFIQPFLAGTMVFAGNLRGAGDTRFPMYVTGASVWSIRVPVASLLTFALGMGLSGAWLGMCMDQMVRGAIFFLRFRGGRWKLAKV
jgi:MATE family multidrug resistance protein